MRFQRLSLSVAGVLAACFFSSAAHANSTGMAGRSGKQTQTCTTACHGLNPSAATPTVVLDGPATLAAGATGNYKLTITGGAGVKGGMNVAVSNNGGTLAIVGSDLKVLNGELTHTAAKAFANGAVEFQFTLKAPATAGTSTLFASGNSTNGDSMQDGDRSASITRDIQITAVNPPDAGTGTPDAGTDNPGNGDEDKGGCSAVGGAPLLALLALLAAAGLRRRSV